MDQGEAEVRMHILRVAGEEGIAQTGQSSIELPSGQVGGQMAEVRQGPGKGVDEAKGIFHPKGAQTCLR